VGTDTTQRLCGEPRDGELVGGSFHDSRNESTIISTILNTSLTLTLSLTLYQHVASTLA